jgi:hypothetical protein
MKDEKGEEFSHMVLVSPWPYESLMRDIRGELIISEGVMMYVPSARLNLTYLNEFSELENYKVFAYGWGPQSVYSTRLKLGLDPDQILTNTGIASVVQLSHQNRALPYMIEIRETKAQLKASYDAHESADEKGLGIAGDFIENSDYVRQFKDTPMNRIKANWDMIWKMGLVGLLILAMLRYRGVV